MYVRNYGTSPRENGHDGVSAPSQEAESAPQESPTVPTATEDTQANSEKTEATVFGANGVPRQPLKRRKRKVKPLECGKSPQNEDAGDQCANIPREPIAPILAPCETAQTHVSGCEGSQKCISPPPPHRCEESKPRTLLGCLTTEDLLLGGLLILLINEGASDDILLILAFLLISGIRFDQ